MEPVKTAVVGLGRIASLLEDDGLREKPCTHAGAVTANRDCILVAGADIDGPRRSLFAGRWRVPVYADAGEMLREHRPSLLCIATPPDSHLRYCALAAKHGVPVVICEKPLADSLGSARKIAALQQKGSVRIITNHERRYAADYAEAREILRKEELGVLLSVKAALYMGRTRRIRDVLWHDGTHLIDALMFLTGCLPRHKACFGSPLSSREGTAFLSGYLKPTDGGGQKPSPASVPFLIEAGAGRDHLVFGMEFSCERGRLRIGNGVFEVWESGPSPYAEMFRSLKKTREGFEGPTGYFANMAADAVACVRDPARKPRSGADDGLRVIEYLHGLG
ncbi:MAG: Gfo/Idh/MocA family oxidoreductase [Spirochaetaceae bacterium]|jgi:predicted dehydrogenase|nr:Gfo/Idh/MocA family oxidoreductase [Spirochaetaceae bacterium]